MYTESLSVRLLTTGCGRKNSPIWEGHSFGWGARTVVGSASSNSCVRAVFSVHHSLVGRTSSLYCWGVYKKWRVAGSNTACISQPRSPDLTPCDFFLWGYLKAKVYEQRPLTLEALKEAIQQEVAAITPEMILKVMDNYRERLHQFINIQGRHLSDVLFKTRWCKAAFCVLSINKKKCDVSSFVSNLLASQIGEIFLPHPVWPVSVLLSVHRVLISKIADYNLSVCYWGYTESLSVRLLTMTSQCAAECTQNPCQ